MEHLLIQALFWSMVRTLLEIGESLQPLFFKKHHHVGLEEELGSLQEYCFNNAVLWEFEIFKTVLIFFTIFH